MIRVLVVDDSAFMRRLLVKLLEPFDDIEVVATAMDGVFALDKLERLGDERPDVVTLDLEMPRLDGLTTLRRIVERFRLPVILVSAHTSTGARVTFDGLAAGAVDFITKPEGIFSMPTEELGADLAAKIRAASRARVRRPPPSREPEAGSAPEESPAAPAPRAPTAASEVLAIAVSTGGPNALSLLLSELQESFEPGILIVQHMPPGFTAQFAERLQKLSELEVREARDGDRVVSGSVLIAPGGRHMALARDDGRMVVRLSDDAPVRGHRPSADVLLRSVADVAGQRSMGLILTGMGEDGAAGMEAIRAAGGHTLAQDENSSVVFGMPRAAIRRGVVDRVLALSEMADYLNQLPSLKKGSPWIA